MMAAIPNRPEANTQPIARSRWDALAVSCVHLQPSTINIASGAISGIVSAIMTCPFDVIKTRLQNQRHIASSTVRGNPQFRYQGFFGTGTAVVRNEGLRGLYRGLGPMVLGYVPTWAIYMSVYEASREYFYERIDNKSLARICSSMVAGTCATTVTNPVWVIKTRFMAQSAPHLHSQGPHPQPHSSRLPYYRSTLSAAKSIYRSEGIRAFYSGLSPALLGLTHVMIQFPLYEFLKSEFTGTEMGENRARRRDDDSNGNGNGSERGAGGGHFIGVLGAILISKVCASAATYPHEVLRTRLQTQRYGPSGTNLHVGAQNGCVEKQGAQAGHTATTGTEKPSGLAPGASAPPNRGLVSLFRTLVREEGWRVLYAGMGTNLIRAVPAAVSMMVTFEICKAAIERLRDRGSAILESEVGVLVRGGDDGAARG